jgi:hypothetical protein
MSCSFYVLKFSFSWGVLVDETQKGFTHDFP